jgi:hypothetical protein
MTEEQITAIRCAYADLKGSFEHMVEGTLHSHDWEAHAESIDDLLKAFQELNLDS